MLGNLADPMIYMLGLGYGLGAMLSEVGGTPASHFRGRYGLLSMMMSATFGLTRGSPHARAKTWDAIMNAPVSLDDVVLGGGMGGEQEPALRHCRARRGVGFGSHAFCACAVGDSGRIPYRLAFASMGLIMTALSPSYDFFMYYFTLAITPMMLVSGVFFPLSQLPAPFQAVAQVLPLTHAVELRGRS